MGRRSVCNSSVRVVHPVRPRHGGTTPGQAGRGASRPAQAAPLHQDSLGHRRIRPGHWHHAGHSCGSRPCPQGGTLTRPPPARGRHCRRHHLGCPGQASLAALLRPVARHTCVHGDGRARTAPFRPRLFGLGARLRGRGTDARGHAAVGIPRRCGPPRHHQPPGGVRHGLDGVLPALPRGARDRRSLHHKRSHDLARLRHRVPARHGQHLHARRARLLGRTRLCRPREAPCAPGALRRARRRMQASRARLRPHRPRA